MGSKASMLHGALGEALAEEARAAKRFVDLFAGTGAVARYIAQAVDIPTVAVDQLAFSAVLTRSVTARTKPFDGRKAVSLWEGRVERKARSLSSLLLEARELSTPNSEKDVLRARELGNSREIASFIWRDYCGYYFSPEQAFWLSLYFETRPKQRAFEQAAVAALIRTASRASASPGHTAQPFRPTEALLPHIRSAWKVPIATTISAEFRGIGAQAAIRRGQAITGDALEFARQSLRQDDLVFCDPPYSEAQYSRFYHVLEAIAVGGWTSVSGAGRAPAGAQRPTSDFSSRSRSIDSFGKLLNACARKGCVVMITYPEGVRSNGLDVAAIERAAHSRFSISEQRIPMRHSTLGGSDNHTSDRSGRKDLHELLITLRPMAD